MTVSSNSMFSNIFPTRPTLHLFYSGQKHYDPLVQWNTNSWSIPFMSLDELFQDSINRTSALQSISHHHKDSFSDTCPDILNHPIPFSVNVTCTDSESSPLSFNEYRDSLTELQEPRCRDYTLQHRAAAIIVLCHL